jgi:glycosyltransferase involved in cell wall biosynthesis
MKVLVLHSRYSSGAISGENRVVDDEVGLLREAGHQVKLWSPEPKTDSWRAQAVQAAHTVWGRRAVRTVSHLIGGFRPDIAHAHNLFPALSPAVLRLSIPTVVTLHNYRLLCLPAVFLRGGMTCEDCIGRLPWRGVIHRCYRDSALGSATLATSLAVHRRAGTFDHVGAYLAVSEFVRAKHIEAGWDPERIIVKPNFVRPLPRRTEPGGYFLFLGRLSPEKGLDRLVSIWGDVPAKLLIVGDGEERSRLQHLARGDVELRGSVDPSQIGELLSGARALMLPSICYEGAPRTVVEAFAAGVPVIANRLGALPGIVDEQSGRLVAPSDPGGWVGAARALLNDDLSVALGAGAYRTWQNRFSSERAILDLEAAYSSVIHASEARLESRES